MDTMHGCRIKELRRVFSMTQAELAYALGVAQQTLAAWEGGRYEPSRFEALVLEQLEAQATPAEAFFRTQALLGSLRTLPPEPAKLRLEALLRGLFGRPDHPRKRARRRAKAAS